ncbi:MAG: hypothetical protein F4Y08_05090 [Caldilineaceae bacterium SB0662_bin_9]|uniref:Uncharacterized protein n=1 Tax=Caldilineaceae bacterium SB0662_bin_9 TaxID=2605258 RepID=A0A6B1DRB8_9CHLR|nr:hypothetical protein [Caldilineaceae bacterium SB0662_bin_9]
MSDPSAVPQNEANGEENLPNQQPSDETRSPRKGCLKRFLQYLAILGVFLLGVGLGLAIGESGDNPVPAPIQDPTSTPATTIRSDTAPEPTATPIATQREFDPSRVLPLQSPDVAATIRARLSESVEVKGNRRGFILSYEGQKCWYTQTATDLETTSYFFENLKGEDTFMEFDDPACMGNSADGPLLGVSQFMANNVLTNWYSKPDAAFGTRPRELMPGSEGQVRGWCIQSETYPTQSILVDYFADSDNNLVALLHGYAMSGCRQ